MASDGSVVFSTELDESGIKSGLRSLGSKVAGWAKGAGVAIASVGSGLATVATKALGAAGQLEQNIGGSEAIFDQYATKVQQTAKDAFETMGISTSDYLSTANKMGSLFKGAGFETEEAMDVTTQAMQRAADVASIMGIDTSWAMESIAGAAKGNFTMMDNLGVAMNDTTLQAYALEKGIDKSTQSMTTQEKVSLAMEMFLERTAYAAGNYAKENETLAGSLSTARAAINNFLSGAGTADELVSSLSNAAEVVVRNFDELFPKLADGLTQAIDQLVPMLPPLIEKVLNAATKLLPMLTKAALALVQGIMKSLTGNAKTIAKDLANMITIAIKGLIPMLPELITGLSVVIVELITALAAELPTLLPPLIDALIQGLLALLENAPALLDAGLAIIKGLGEGLFNALPTLLASIPQLLQAFLSTLSNVWETLIYPALQGIMKAVFGVELPDWGALVAKIKADWNEKVWPKIQGFFKDTFGIELPSFSVVADTIKTWWKDVTEAVGNVFKAVFSIFTMDTENKDAAQIITEWWDGVMTSLGDIFRAFFGIELPDAVEAIREWWQTQVEKIEKFFTVTLGINIPSPDDDGTLSPYPYMKSQKFKESADTPATEAAAADVNGAISTYETASSTIIRARNDSFTPTEGEAKPTPMAEATEADIQGAIDTMHNKTGEVQTASKTVTGDAIAAGNTAAGGATSVGANLAGGIAAGVYSNSDAVSNALKSVVQNGLSSAQKYAEIKSPSRLFADKLGAFLPAGAAMGVENNAWMLRSAVDDMLAGSVPDVGAALGDISTPFGQRQADSLTPASALDLGGLAATVASAVRAGMSGVAFVINDQRVADFVTERVSQNIAQEAWEGRYA